MLVMLQPYVKIPNPLVDDNVSVSFETLKNITVLDNDTISFDFSGFSVANIHPSITLSNNDKTLTNTGFFPRSTIYEPRHTSRKYYFEVTWDSGPGGGGIGITTTISAASNTPGQLTGGISYTADGKVEKDGPVIDTLPTWTVGDTVGLLYEAGSSIDNIQFVYQNGSLSPVYNVSSTGLYYFAATVLDTSVATVNYGETPFVHNLPSGYFPWGTAEVVITITTPPTNGTAIVGGDGVSIDYTPNNGYLGPDSFEYDVDASGSPATVNITVQ